MIADSRRSTSTLREAIAPGLSRGNYIAICECLDERFQYCAPRLATRLTKCKCLSEHVCCTMTPKSIKSAGGRNVQFETTLMLEVE